MVAVLSNSSQQQKEALLIMFGRVWQKKFWPLDGQQGRPSLGDCVDLALKRHNNKTRDDLVTYVENYLDSMSRRCEAHAKNNAPS